MSRSPNPDRDELILIHAPIGRDARLLDELFHRAGLQSAVCPDIPALCQSIEFGAGAIFITEESLENGALESLSSALKKHRTSTLPLVLLTAGGEPTYASRDRLHGLESLGDLALLERPLRSDTLVSAARAALRVHAKHNEVRRRDAELQIVTDNVPVLISYVDASHIYRRVNQTYFEWFGKEPGDIVGRHVRDLSGDEHYAVARPYLDRALAGERVSFESRIRDKNGRERDVAVFYAPDVSPTGQNRGLVALVQDITARKQTERQNLFLVRLDDESRSLTDPEEITQTAARLLGMHLEVNRCAYADVEDDQDSFDINGNYTDNIHSIVGHYTFQQFGSDCLNLMRNGQPFVVEDAETDPRIACCRDAYRDAGIRSMICVPLKKLDRLVAAMAVHRIVPWKWSADEVSLVRQVADRCWESIERARVVRDLQASEEQFRTLANAIPNLAWMARADGHTFWYNDRWYDYTGTRPEQMEGVGWQSVHDPEILPEVRDRWNISLRTGQPFEMVFPLRGANSVFEPFLTRIEPIRDASGSVARWFGTSTNIASQQKAERELREREQELRIALETARLGSWTLDLRTQELTCSTRSYENFGIPLTEPFTYSRLLAAIHPEDRQAVEEKLRHAIQTRADYRAEYRIIRPDGSPGWIVASGRALYAADGTPRSMVGVTMDVSARTIAEQDLRRSNESLMRANKELEEFAYVASHDLQEPLRMVNSYSQLLIKRLGPQADDELRKFMNYISTGVRRMETLIRDLLSYSRTSHVDDSPVQGADLNSALQQALSRVDAGIQETRAQVVAAPLPTVAGEETQLSHVFQNLLSNSLKYRKDGVDPLIQIGAERRNGHWLVSVQDNGIGFDPGQSERVFGLFKRLHREEQYPGTGLGLAICKRIVERYGGRIWAESQEGIGSTFYMTLKDPQ